MDTQRLNTKLLARAARKAGGLEELARLLGVSRALLQRYISGDFPLPSVLFLRAVDLVLDDSGVPRPADESGSRSLRPDQD